jgi:hypothetical protein
MGNIPSIFCPTDVPSKATSRFLTIPSSDAVMLSNAVSSECPVHVLTRHTLQRSSTARPDPSSNVRTSSASQRSSRTKCHGSTARINAQQYKPTDSLPKHLRFKQKNARGPKARKQAPYLANRKAPPSARQSAPHHATPHSNLYSAKPSSKTKSSPNFVRSTVIGPPPKHSRKWINRRDAKVQRDQVQPQDRTDTRRSEFNLLSTAELDIFCRKIDAINADLDTIYGKDEPYPECRESEENARERVLINNHRRVIKDLCMPSILPHHSRVQAPTSCWPYHRKLAHHYPTR